MTFSQLATVFDAIEKEQSRTRITELLADLFTQTAVTEMHMVCNMALGTLRPAYQGMQFNVAEKTLVEVVASLLGMSASAVMQEKKVVGDLGALYAQKSTTKKSTMTIEQVYNSLSVIESISGVGSQEIRMNAIQNLLQSLDPVAGKYIIRMILGTLRLGFSDMTIIDALSWMMVGNKSLHATIEHAYNICADLGMIAAMLKKDGIEAVQNMTIHVGVPIRPAGAERLPSAHDIVEKIGPCVVQPKLDGFRLQIHIDNTGDEPKIFFFSRHLVNMSYMFPDLKVAFEKSPFKSVIIEGEAIVYDPDTDRFLPFQETAKRKRKHGIEEAVAEFPLRIYLFDLLYLDGVSYLHETHETRRAQLKEVVEQIQHPAVRLVEEQPIMTADDLEQYVHEQLEQGLEGVVVKRPQAPYQAGKRNFNWIKLKHEQTQGLLEDTIDAVILGYYAGSGKRAHFGIGAFLVGVYNKERDIFQTIAKVGTGLKDDEWRELKNKCDLFRAVEQPKNVECVRDLVPDVWVMPEMVCSIRADEITRSPLHTAGATHEQTGYALRFPRFVQYRTDKSAAEATTVHEIERLFEDQK